MLSRSAICRASVALVFVLAAFALSTGKTFAQTASFIAGGHGTITTYYSGTNESAVHDWEIVEHTSKQDVQVASGVATEPYENTPFTSNNWTFSYSGATAVITAPATAAVASYSFEVVTKQTGSGENIDFYGYLGDFNIVGNKPGPSSGPAYPWQGSVGGVNTATGNKMTVVPITGWTTPGGLPLSLALTHNSQMPYSFPNFNGQKWTFSYQNFVVQTDATHAKVYWGDGRIDTYKGSFNSNTSYSAPAGVYDTLTSNNSTFTLKTQGQVTYQFSQPGTQTLQNYYFLSTITDENSNKITVTYAASTNDIVTGVSDSTDRALNFYYANGLMTKVTDPIGRFWTFGYNGSGDLTTITLPALNTVTHSYSIGYDPNSHHDIASFTDLNGNTASFVYNTDDSLATAQDPLGNVTTFSYTSTATTIKDPNGYTTVHNYVNDLTSITDALGQTEYHTYDDYNSQTSTKNRRGNTSSFGVSYDTQKPPQISGVTTTDPVGNVTTTVYTSKNKVSSVTAPSPNTAGQTVVTTYAYDGSDNPTGVTSPTPNQVGPNGATTVTATTNYAPVTDPNKTSVTWYLPSQTSAPYTSNSDTHSTAFGYDPNGYLNSVTHGTVGDTVTSAYDTLGRLSSATTHPSTVLTDTTNYTYDSWGRVTSVMAPDNTLTNTTYDLNGNVLRVEDANASDGTLHGATWTAGYFGSGLQFNGTSGWVDLGGKADLNFTGAVTLSALVKPASTGGYQNIIAHGTGSGSDVALRINNGSYEIESYNSVTGRGEGTSYAIPSGDLNHWVNLIGTFDGTTWRLYRDGTQVASASGTTGAVVLSGDWALGATGAGSARFFNGTIDDARVFNRAVLASEVAQLNNPAGPSTVSDGLLGYWRLDDGTGAATTVDWCHSVTNAYDQDNRLLWTFNGHLDWVQYFYDASNSHSGHVQNPYQAEQLGLLSYKTDGNGNTTYYVYDKDNRPTQTVLPDGTMPSVTYDADGNVATRLDANGILTTYTYDADDRLTDKKYTLSGNAYTTYGTCNVHLDYYPGGGLKDMMDAAGTTTWTYDNAGNVASVGSGRGTVSYAYYDNGLRSQMTAFESGITSSTWTYAYDTANRPQTLTDPSGVTTTFGFDLADRLTSKAFSNGPTTTLAYDNCDEVQSIITKNSSNSVLVQNAYTYDPAGNVATRTDTDGTIASFGYNGGDQLTAESYYQSGVNSYITYSYDHNGNRATQNVNNSALTTYAYNSTDELTSDSTGGAYTYDQNGNWTKLVSGGNTYQFQYDAENKLTYYQSPSASSSYIYNGSGLRVTENDSGSSGEHDYLHDGSAPASGLLVDSNLTGSTLFHVYTPGIDQSDASTGAVHLMAEDALGTVRGFVNDNAAGAVTDTFGAFAFGAPRTRTGSDAFSLAWGGADGYQTDANGLVLMGNRVYHVYTGRFLTRDPAGAGDNDYEYADDSPVNEIDSDGRSPATLNGSFGSVGGGDLGSWFDGDMFDSVYSPTGVNLTGKSVMGSTDYYLYEWDKAPGKDWTFAGMSYLFTQYTLDDTTGDAAKGPPVSYEPGVEGGKKGVWKNYKNGSREFEPDPEDPVKKKGHGDGGRNQGADEEHSRNAKGNRSPRSTGGSRHFDDNAVNAATIAGVGYIIWEGLKWTAAGVAAPETAGGSLILAGVVP